MLMMAFVFTGCEKDADGDSAVVDGWELDTELTYEKTDHKDFRRFFLRASLRDTHNNDLVVEDNVYFQIWYSETGKDGDWKRIETINQVGSMSYTFDAEHRDEPYNVYFFVSSSYRNTDIESNTLTGEVPTEK